MKVAAQALMGPLRGNAGLSEFLFELVSSFSFLFFFPVVHERPKPPRAPLSLRRPDLLSNPQPSGVCQLISLCARGMALHGTDRHVDWCGFDRAQSVSLVHLWILVNCNAEVPSQMLARLERA